MFAGSSPITSPRHLRKHARSQGPLLRRRYPASTLIRPCPTPARAAALSDVEAATLAHDGSPPITRITLPACRAHYPGGPDGCLRRSLPRPRGLPRIAGGSASASSLSRPAQALLTLRPVGSLGRPRRPLSRGFNPVSCPTKPLVSYQTYRHLSGWNLPPLVTRAVGAHSDIREAGFRRYSRISLPLMRATKIFPSYNRAYLTGLLASHALRPG